jgi:hypothetical protein
MASDVDICNLALLHLGTRSSISSLTEGSAEANACALVYPVTRDLLLTQHKWGFATRRTALADLGSPPDEWAYRYAYPTDCLLARAIHQPIGTGGFVPFTVSGDLDPAGNPLRVVLTDQARAELIYTARISSAAMFDPGFASALSWLVAAELAVTLTGDRTLAQACVQTATASVAASRAVDANEAPTVMDFDAEWVRLRGLSV